VTGAANDVGVIGSLTAIHLILIALFAVVTIIAIIFAARIRASAARQRLEAGEASDRLVEISEVDAPTAPPPLADTPTFSETPPPPSYVPVVAAAPLDAGPATLAGDMEPVREAPKASQADDLTRMKGIGPKLAAQLGALGYTRFSQIAGLSPIEADALDAQLGAFKGRLARDRVVEQADYLAKGDIAGFESVFGKM
jgi:predicted flap endonuclease-1-like 5' DNA nuclease